MLKKVIKYEDFDGHMVTEDHYFHLGVNTIIKMESEAREALGDEKPKSEEMGACLEAWIGRELAAKDIVRGLKVLGKFIDRSYGLRDGAAFRQSPEISSEFASSLAFDAFFTELMTDERLALAFVTGMMPSQLRGNQQIPGRLVEAGFSRDAVTSVLPEQPVITASLPAETPVVKGELVVTEEEELSDEEFQRTQEDAASGLKNPRDAKGDLLPWAFREPTRVETSRMEKKQMVDVYRRRASGDWEPTVGG